MVELFNLDDVGQGYDLALGEEGRIGVTLGRHINDEVTSFYANTPSGFMMEYGWGGRVIDVDNWQPEEVTWGPSMWGHDRMWMPPEGRVGPRFSQADLMLQAATQGLGVALARYSLVHDDLVAGRLVPVLTKGTLRTRYDYYLVSLPRKAERPAVAAFREWLLAEARAFMAARKTRV